MEERIFYIIIRELCDEMGEKGRRYVNERFNWKVICDNLADMIEYAGSK